MTLGFHKMYVCAGNRKSKSYQYDLTVVDGRTVTNKFRSLKKLCFFARFLFVCLANVGMYSSCCTFPRSVCLCWGLTTQIDKRTACTKCKTRGWWMDQKMFLRGTCDD